MKFSEVKKDLARTGWTLIRLEEGNALAYRIAGDEILVAWFCKPGVHALWSQADHATVSLTEEDLETITAAKRGEW